MAERKKCNTARIKQPKLEYEGYHFHYNKSYGDTIYYECSFRKNKDVQCKAKLKMENGHYTLSGRHEHDKPIFKLAEIKKEIEASHAFDSTRIIKKGIISKYNNLLHLTSIANVEKSIERYKKKIVLDRFQKI